MVSYRHISMATAAPAVTRVDTATRILDAAFERITEVGLSRTTVEDVARAARLTRQTIYRYFPSKDRLVMALVLREEERLLDGVRAAFVVTGSLEDALYEASLFCLTWAREHPLLDRLLETDAQTLLPYLTVRSAPLIDRARDVLGHLMASKAWVRAGILEGAADAGVRVLLSYAVTRPQRAPADVARDLSRIFTAALTGKEARR
ncbi:MAG TPA: TetR family transcriptional regulator [Actinomycetota bacterium]|nr:TetR family transcriptional regulator [Actinomycetota bacterium]